MPKGDRTGPMGQGAMTGRQAGYCSGFPTPGFTNTPYGQGFGMGVYRGRGARGYGWRNMFYATGRPGRVRYGRFGRPAAYPAADLQADPEWEVRELKKQAEILQADLDHINQRLNEIEKIKES